MGVASSQSTCNYSIIQVSSISATTNIPNLQPHLVFSATDSDRFEFWPGYIKNAQNQICGFNGKA